MENWHSEIVRMHNFFEEYLRGTIQKGEIDRIDQAFASNFVMVAPDGAIVNLEIIKSVIGAIHGTIPSMKMSITDATLIDRSSERLVARYVEAQDYEGGKNRRVATVVFAENASGPNGLEWLTVQETWLPEG